jgi:hypothetical protein
LKVKKVFKQQEQEETKITDQAASWEELRYIKSKNTKEPKD